MKDKDYGPDFPSDFPHIGDGPDRMTLRDWFAGQVMAGLLAQSHCPQFETKAELQSHFAVTAYQYADAMIKARGTQ